MKNFNVKVTIAVCLLVVVLSVALIYAYNKRKTIQPRISVQAAAAKTLTLPSGAVFPGLVIVQEQKAGCATQQGCGTPSLRTRHAIRATGETAIATWDLTSPDQPETDIIRVSGKYIEVRHHLRSKVTYPKLRSTDPTEMLAGRTDPASKCQLTMTGEPKFNSKFTHLAGEEYLSLPGVPKPVLTYVFLDESSSTTAKHWYAPDFACFSVQDEYHGKESKTPNSYTYVKTMQVRLEEPDPLLFRDPEDYDEVPPSELYRRDFFHKMAKIQDEAKTKAEWEEQKLRQANALTQTDARYHAQRARAGVTN